MRQKTLVDDAKVAELYAAGLDTRTVGKVIGVSHNIVSRSLHESGVTIRPRHWSGGMTVSGGYAYLHRPGHPRANKRGYVMRAIVAWEEASGLPLPKGMFPHHDNEIPLDDRAENIRPMTRPEHSRLHGKRRGGLNGQGEQGHAVKDNVEHKEQRHQDGAGGQTDT